MLRNLEKYTMLHTKVIAIGEKGVRSKPIKKPRNIFRPRVDTATLFDTCFNRDEGLLEEHRAIKSKLKEAQKTPLNDQERAQYNDDVAQFWEKVSPDSGPCVAFSFITCTNEQLNADTLDPRYFNEIIEMTKAHSDWFDNREKGHGMRPIEKFMPRDYIKKYKRTSKADFILTKSEKASQVAEDILLFRQRHHLDRGEDSIVISMACPSVKGPDGTAILPAHQFCVKFPRDYVYCYDTSTLRNPTKRDSVDIKKGVSDQLNQMYNKWVRQAKEMKQEQFVSWENVHIAVGWYPKRKSLPRRIGRWVRKRVKGLRNWAKLEFSEQRFEFPGTFVGIHKEIRVVLRRIDNWHSRDVSQYKINFIKRTKRQIGKVYHHLTDPIWSRLIKIILPS